MTQHRRGARAIPGPGIGAHDIEEARGVQQAMFPGGPLRDRLIEVEFKFRPLANVGGDFLDYYQMADRRVGFFLGDVVGKGLPAALYAALALGVMRGINKREATPSRVLAFLNRRLLDRAVPNRYCSVQYGVFDPSSLELSVANAGLRPAPLHISRAGCREVGHGGFPCGLFPQAYYDEHRVLLGPGDSILFCTDGLIEARNYQGQEFGLERLKQACTATRSASPATLLDRLFATVDRFAAGVPQHDDMTAVVLRLS